MFWGVENKGKFILWMVFFVFLSLDTVSPIGSVG